MRVRGERVSDVGCGLRLRVCGLRVVFYCFLGVLAMCLHFLSHRLQFLVSI